MKILITETSGKSTTLRVLEVAPTALAKSGGAWTLAPGASSEEVVSMKVGGGPKNVETRAARLCERHDAVDLADTDAIGRAVAAAKVTRKKVAPPVEQGDVHEGRGENPWEEGASEDDLGAILDDDEGDDLGTILDDEGGDDLGAILDSPDLDEQDTPRPPVDGPVDLTDPGTGEDPGEVVEPRGGRKGRRSPPPVDPETIDEAALDEQLVELGWDPEKIDAMDLDTKVAAVKQGKIERIRVAPPPPKAHRAAARREGIRTEDQRQPIIASAVRGYRLTVWRKDWPTHTTADGTPTHRDYVVGDTPDENEVKRVAEAWAERGFEIAITALPYHHKAPQAKRTIWAAAPFDPILCHVPQCTWVGDHLGPHLKIHGFTTEEYRTTFNYRGPIIVGNASSSLDAAHDAVRRRNDVHPGAFLVEIKGTSSVDVWRVVRVNGLGEAAEFTVEPLDGKGRTTMGPTDLFRRFRPVGTWTHRLLREMGQERRKR